MKAYRLAVLSALALATLPAAALSACGSSSSPTDAAGDDDDDASMSTSEAGGGNGDSSTAGDSGQITKVPPPDGSTTSMMDATPDAPVSDGAPVPEPDAGACDPNEKVDGTQVFVSTKTGSSTTGNCTNNSPCTTISAALAAAVTNGHQSIVYIDEGSYTEQVVIPPGIARIRGGWMYAGGTWTNDCNGNNRLTATTITAPSTANKTIVAQDIMGTTSLEALSISTKSVGNTSESLYGVFATGTSTTLSLIDTSVVAKSGGPGAPGTAGSTGTAGGSTCTAGTNPPAAAAMATVPTTVGANATYSAAGATPSNGPTGTIGGSGGNGVGGPPGACTEAYTCDGSKGDCNKDDDGQVCAPTALPGCGGGPGGLGGGGGGGGSSIALFAWDAQVSVNGGGLQGGSGGVGGPGAGGGAGGTGSASAPTSMFVTTGCSDNCLAMKTELKGLAGVTGANGADGPGGGGGAGGDSYAYYRNNDNVMIGIVGVGDGPAAAMGGSGSGKAPAGPPGLSAQHNQQ